MGWFIRQQRSVSQHPVVLTAAKTHAQTRPRLPLMIVLLSKDGFVVARFRRP
jgi:hypothetical protein